MGAPYTLTFGAYTFPNQTFEVQGLGVANTLDEARLPRRPGSLILAQKLGPRMFKVVGQLHGAVAETVHSQLNTMLANLAMAGKQNLQYRADRYAKGWLRNFGHSYPEGGFHHAADVQIDFAADDPFLYDTVGQTHTQALDSLVGGSATFDVVNPGEFTAVPVFTLRAGVTITDNILVHNRTTGERFQWHGTLNAGQTLTVDAEAFTVTYDSTDGLTWLDGDFVGLVAATNDFKYTGATLTLFRVTYRRRYLA